MPVVCGCAAVSGASLSIYVAAVEKFSTRNRKDPKRSIVLAMIHVSDEYFKAASFASSDLASETGAEVEFDVGVNWHMHHLIK